MREGAKSRKAIGIGTNHDGLEGESEVIRKVPTLIHNESFKVLLEIGVGSGAIFCQHG